MWGIDCGKFNGLFLFLNWAYIVETRITEGDSYRGVTSVGFNSQGCAQF